MNLKITETKENYQKMLFKEALRTGFYEFQAARDKYVQLSASDGVNLNLIMKFIEIQTVLMAPICPHVAEHVWSLIEKVNFSILSIPFVNFEYLFIRAYFRFRMTVFWRLVGPQLVQ